VSSEFSGNELIDYGISHAEEARMADGVFSGLSGRRDGDQQQRYTRHRRDVVPAAEESR
jgi:hypothetical protein